MLKSIETEENPTDDVSVEQTSTAASDGDVRSRHESSLDIAADHLEKAAQTLPRLEKQDQLGIELRTELARVLLKVGKPDASNALVNAVLDVGAERLSVLLVKIDAALELGNVVEALFACERAKPLFKMQGAYLQKKLAIFDRTNQHRESAQVLAELLELEPDDVNLLTKLGFKHLNNGDLKDAKDVFAKTVSIDPANSKAWVGLVNAASKSDGPIVALPFAEEALAALPDDADVINRVAAAYIATNRNEEARSILENALNAGHEPPVSLRVTYASVLKKLKSFDEAEAQHKIILSQNPKHAGAWTGRIQTAFEQNDVELALQVSSEAVDALPDDLGLATLRSQALIRARLYVDAIEFLETLYAKHPENRQVAMSLAKALSAAGRKDEVVSIYDAILREDPEDWDALKARVAIAVNDGDLKLASKFLEGMSAA